MELRPGSGSPAGIRPSGSGPSEHGDTTHVDVIDAEGNLSTATPSGGWLQSSPVIPGLGFPLGTRCQQFNLVEGHPNALAPGKRPRTTLSPPLSCATASRTWSSGPRAATTRISGRCSSS